MRKFLGGCTFSFENFNCHLTLFIFLSQVVIHVGTAPNNHRFCHTGTVSMHYNCLNIIIFGSFFTCWQLCAIRGGVGRSMAD